MKSSQQIPGSRLKQIRKLNQKKYREQAGQFLVEGVHLLEEVLNSSWVVAEVLITPDFRDQKPAAKIFKRAGELKVPIFTIGERELALLADTVTAQGVVGVVAERKAKLENVWSRNPARSIVVALDGVSDPGNVGAVIRTCDWFGADAVLLGKGSVELHNPKVVRSSMGSIFHLPIIEDVDLESALAAAKREGYTSYCTVAKGGVEIGKHKLHPKTVLIFGSEAHGISTGVQRKADDSLTIPRVGQAESLNVAVASGVILATLRLQE